MYLKLTLNTKGRKGSERDGYTHDLNPPERHTLDKPVYRQATKRKAPSWKIQHIYEVSETTFLFIRHDEFRARCPNAHWPVQPLPCC